MVAGGSVTASLLALFLAILSFSSPCSAVDLIPKVRLIRDGENITSAGKKFVLGFFSPEGTTNRYVGIWYDNVSPKSVVWVANREYPILDRKGAFGISDDGNLVVLDGKNVPIWRANTSAASNNATMVLKDNGELIICKNPGNFFNGILWGSFNHPTDTFLPRMRANASAGERKIFTSWSSASDPSPGRFSMGIDSRASPQIVIWDGEKRRWRSGHWNGLVFLGVPSMQAHIFYGFRLDTDNGRNFKYSPSNPSDLIRFMVDLEGNELQQRWDESSRQWSEIQSQPADACGIYNQCGKFARCDNSSSPEICSCLHGFVPSDLDEWNSGNRSGGCVRRTELQCRRNITEDGFLEVADIKLPDLADAENDAQNAKQCKKKCEDDCSCNGYASFDGIQCMIWRNELVDIQQFGKGSGSTLFLRLAHSELGDNSKRTSIIVAVTSAAASLILVTLAIWILYKHRAKFLGGGKKDEMEQSELPSSGESSTEDGQCEFRVEGEQGTGSDLVFFSFTSMAAATNYFSHKNKLGQGGFGHVYKGVLPSGQEIAVKRLSRKSGQGMKEFTNELTVIAKLQHRNLVRLLGCCVEREEKMLLYEYMPNKSLDCFLFDPAKRSELNWRKRYQIIEEIARGLLYLHRDSRLRIIHRDLKASNILLDGEMNPKISDFGMARIFGGNQNEENTNRVVGTYGYMAPEFAMEGLFSVKSDVYSFGVLLLEIVSGRRNTSFRSVDHSGIIEYAWDQWDQGKPMSLMDVSIFSSCVPHQVLRCIQIGLLCVQDLAVHRPNMSSVVLFLETDNVTLPAPRPPTYTASMRRSDDVESWNRSGEHPTSNTITLSVIVGR